MVAVVESEYLQHRFLRLFKHFLKMLHDFLFFLFFSMSSKTVFFSAAPAVAAAFYPQVDSASIKPTPVGGT